MRAIGLVWFGAVVMSAVAMMSYGCSSSKGAECTKLSACCKGDATCTKVVNNNVENDCKTAQILYCGTSDGGATDGGGDTGSPITCASVCGKVCMGADKASCEMGCASVGDKCKAHLNSFMACIDSKPGSTCMGGQPSNSACANDYTALTNCVIANTDASMCKPISSLCMQGDCCESGGLCAAQLAGTAMACCLPNPGTACTKMLDCCDFMGKQLACQASKCCVEDNNPCGGDQDCCGGQCMNGTCM